MIPRNFYEVSFTGKAEIIREERESAEEFPAGPMLVAWSVDRLVDKIAEKGVLVGAAQTVDEFQVGAALTVSPVMGKS